MGWNIRRCGSVLISAALVAVCLTIDRAPASTVVSATKEDVAGSCQVTMGGNIAIATTQTVHWEATRMTTPDCYNGATFALDRGDGPPLNDVTLSSSLPDGIPAADDAVLTPGNYRIFIEFANTGAGTYSVTFNRQASLHISPGSHDFGDVLANASSSVFSFTLSDSGDAGDFDIAIDSAALSGPGAGNFHITTDPTGQTVTHTASKTVAVRCDGNNSPGVKSATLTVHGHGAGTTMPTSVTATLTCNVHPLVPEFSCAASTDLGHADWTVPGATATNSVVLNNTGTADLNVSNVVLVSMAGPGVFAMGAPPIGTIGPGLHASVPITFNAAVAGAEGTYSGHLTVTHNATGSPSTCNFTATAHHPVPIMRIESTSLDFHDVEIGFTFTKAIIVHNDGDAPLVVTVADPSPLPADAAQWSERDTGTFTINPGDPPHAYKQACTPTAAGSYATSMLATSNDTVHPSATVIMTCAGIPPVPIDAVLVLDRSGSMAGQLGGVGPRKIEVLQRAASLFVDLLNVRAQPVPDALADKIGIVKYNQASSVYLGLDVDKDAHHADAINNKLAPSAIDDINLLKPDGTTGIGGAMQTGAGMISGSPSDRKHVMVLLTDGIENQTPTIHDVMTGPSAITTVDPLLKIYSVGLGADSDINAQALQDITNVSNGFHQVSHELDDLHVFDLEAFFFKIFTESAGWQMVVDPTFVADLTTNAPVVIDTAHITTSDHSAVFLALDNPALRSMYTLELVDPNGHVIIPGSTVGGVPVHVQANNDYRVVRVIFPDISDSASYVGDWVLRLTPNSNWDPAKIRQLAAVDQSANGNGQVSPMQGRVPVGFGAAVASDYQLAVAAMASNYQPGAQITLTATLTDRGWPSPNGSASVDIDTPSGAHYPAMTMYDDGTHGDSLAGDGVWTVRFTQTPQSGSYKFHFMTAGHNDRGELAPREATRYVSLMSVNPGGPGSGGPACISCTLQWLLWAVVIGLLLLSLLCCFLKLWRG
jgi:hypothetical protein